VEPILAEDLVRQHPTGRGINGVSFSVEAGRCLGVLGPNGSGKTTLTRLVAGLARPQRGRLSVLGAPAFPRPTRLRMRCGIALDRPAHWENLTGRDNLSFFARQYGLAGSALRRRVEGLLADADLLAQADDPVETYSFGMRRKLALVEALVHDPDLLILDEPSAGADAAFLERLMHWIRQRCERGRTTWVADNDPDWLARAATHALLLAAGRIEARGAVPELMASIGARNRIEIVLEGSSWDETPDIEGIYEYRCEGSRMSVEVDGRAELPAQLLQWVIAHRGHVKTLEVHAVTLREALARRAARPEGAP
jgi:ABC-type multidrug transport system ATPase subunit